MQLSPDKEYTGVYASYPALPSSEAFLQKVSQQMKKLVENDHLLEKGARVILPKHYHLTLDYAGKISDILSYVEDIQSRKKPSASSKLRFPRMNEWKSNIDGKTVVRASPHPNDVIPFALPGSSNPHLTLAEIESEDPYFRLRFMLTLPNFVDIRRDTREESDIDAVEVDTSKVQIWWKVDGVKQLIIEV